MPTAPGSVSFLIPRSVICCPAAKALKTHFAPTVSAGKDSVTTQHQYAMSKVLLTYSIMRYFLPLSVCPSLFSLYLRETKRERDENLQTVFNEKWEFDYVHNTPINVNIHGRVMIFTKDSIRSCHQHWCTIIFKLFEGAVKKSRVAGVLFLCFISFLWSNFSKSFEGSTWGVHFFPYLLSLSFSPFSSNFLIFQLGSYIFKVNATEIFLMLKRTY